MSATVTVTGVTGPGSAVTSLVVNNVVSVVFDTQTNVLKLTNTNGVVKDIAITSAATITATKSGSTYTFTIS